eukprot:CAMPEP_0202890778 /NCGR_PEP_ID=MMETSP1392-20130828/1082_1 /ASSEMBLY_ACC=CAM_ASM_000868 /TAXON_ID=225041 /ORGANISM="Chlamydomonas chlamydogama, Strain SAG 11-48b" /LENGTH=102 /DNA_ID=CAMNT_0049574415 /DNA_START=70 /DNA_END=374 /DNA_ORIENTATION=-
MSITKEAAMTACRNAQLTDDELGKILFFLGHLTEDYLQQSLLKANDRPRVVVAWVREAMKGRQQPAIPTPPPSASRAAPGDRWLRQILLALLRFLNPYGSET